MRGGAGVDRYERADVLPSNALVGYSGIRRARTLPVQSLWNDRVLGALPDPRRVERSGHSRAVEVARERRARSQVPCEGSGVVPAVTMRGRYIMREYWTDSDLFLRLDARERELYIGLWMLADDHGWMPRDVPAIAAAIYHYEDRAFREGFVRKGLDRLRDLGKLESFRCCIHLPAVERYPRAGRKSDEHLLEHQKHSNGSKGIKSHSDPSPVPSRRNPSLPDVAGERADEPRSLRDVLPPPPGYRQKATA